MEGDVKIHVESNRSRGDGRTMTILNSSRKANTFERGKHSISRAKHASDAEEAERRMPTSSVTGMVKEHAPGQERIQIVEGAQWIESKEFNVKRSKATEKNHIGIETIEFESEMIGGRLIDRDEGGVGNQISKSKAKERKIGRANGSMLRHDKIQQTKAKTPVLKR